MSEHNVLYIVEGETEKSLLKRLWSRFEPDNSYEVYVYNTNIHVMIQSLFQEGELDEDLEIVRDLRSMEKDEEKRAILGKRFEYVYMIFDFDPHDSRVDMEKIAQMMDFFNDPGGNGRLYLNYPMVESYRHLKSLADADFKDRKVSLDILKKGEYKKLVEAESGKEFKQLNNYTKEMFKEIIELHLQKENYIVNGVFELMNKGGFFDLTGSELLRIQVKSIEESESVFVINTCIFTVVEYMPSVFFGKNE